LSFCYVYAGDQIANGNGEKDFDARCPVGEGGEGGTGDCGA